MPKKLTLIAWFAMTSLGLLSQRSNLEFTFTAENNGVYVQLDSIKVMNRTQGGETMIYWPDTTLSLEINPGDLLLFVGYATFSSVGVQEMDKEAFSFEVHQNFPNPLGDQSEVSMFIPQKGKVQVIITDLQGRIALRTDRQLDKGFHSFRFHPGGSNIYFLTAYWNGMSRSIKMITTGQKDGKSCRLEYNGAKTGEAVLKAFMQVNDLIVRQSGILDIPEEDTTYTFQFATNIPCPGIPTVEYEGQIYNTIQIFSQCWLKENLNVGAIIPGTIEQSNNGTIEKYCYNNDPDSCAKYGGLYQWNEMMQYTTQPGVRGICPPGWYVPADEEWKVLQGAVDSQFGIGDPEWDLFWDFRGYDAGTNLKTTSSWYGNGSDIFDFSGMPGGFRNSFDGGFNNISYYGYWWSSTQHFNPANGAWFHRLDYGRSEVFRYYNSKGLGYSVRCLWDKNFQPIELTFTAVDNTSYIQLDSIKVINRTQELATMLFGSDTTLTLSFELPFNPGDVLLCIGYADGLESGFVDSPEESTSYTFQFATNIPCPGIPTVEYEGQIYNTIQIFSQCWLKENLNVGEMIPGIMEQSNNGTIEKYCYNNDPDSCAKYGGLYQWNEMMQYTTQPGVRGICPPGWYVPADEEWKVLEGAVDSQYGIGNNIWNNLGHRGSDAGTNLKTESGWNGNGNGSDLYGFTGLPGGYRYLYAGDHFYDIGSFGYWWTSTASSPYASSSREIRFYSQGIVRTDFYTVTGYSVRCLRDE